MKLCPYSDHLNQQLQNQKEDAIPITTITTKEAWDNQWQIVIFKRDKETTDQISEQQR